MSHYHDSDDLKSLRELRKLAPNDYNAFLVLDAIVAREDGAIPRRYRQLIALAVACTTQCPYCLHVHTRNAKKAGATREEVRSRRRFSPRPCARERRADGGRLRVRRAGRPRVGHVSGDSRRTGARGRLVRSDSRRAPRRAAVLAVLEARQSVGRCHHRGGTVGRRKSYGVTPISLSMLRNVRSA